MADKEQGRSRNHAGERSTPRCTHCLRPEEGRDPAARNDGDADGMQHTICGMSMVRGVIVTEIAIMFHHSNLQLPIGVERRLCRLVVTPRMHGIHHSIVPGEANANWSTILAFADYLHGTCRLNGPQQDVGIGVPEFRDPDELRLPEIIRMPFGKQRPFWMLPHNGTPERPPCRRSLDARSPSSAVSACYGDSRPRTLMHTLTDTDSRASSLAPHSAGA